MNSRRCWVSNCRNSNSEILEKTNTQLFRFPLNKEKCQEWVSAIGDPDLSSHTWEALNKCGYVCKDHFEEKHTTAVSEITENAVPTVFRNFRSPSDPELMLLETDSDKKSVLGCGYNETSSSSVEPVINQNPMMDDIVMEAESIIKLEEVKVEPTDYGEETTSIFVNEVPLLIPKEEVAEVKQEEENETPLLIPKEEVAEINQEEENEMPLLVEPMEEVEEIKQEEEKELEPLAAVFITSSDVNEYETQTGGCVPKRAINRTRRTNVSLPVVSSAEVAEIIRNYVENYRRDRRLEDTSDDSSSQEARSLPKSAEAPQEHNEQQTMRQRRRRPRRANKAEAGFSPKQLKDHVRPTRNPTLQCSECDATFTSSQGLDDHRRQHSGMEPPLSDPATHKPEHTAERTHTSDGRKKAFHHSRDPAVHKQSHKGEKPYKCDVCAKAFNKSHDLTVHKRLHMGEKPYQCDVCGKSFNHLGYLTVHKRHHTGEKPYQCDVCGKTFSLSESLAVHKRLHTGEKPYPCDVCGKSFTCSVNLTVHKLIHTGEKPYPCDVCGQSFSCSVNLTVHKRLHTGEKPYPCDVCGKSFKHLGYLTVHKRLHTGEKP